MGTEIINSIRSIYIYSSYTCIVKPHWILVQFSCLWCIIPYAFMYARKLNIQYIILSLCTIIVTRDSVQQPWFVRPTCQNRYRTVARIIHLSCLTDRARARAVYRRCRRRRRFVRETWKISLDLAIQF